MERYYQKNLECMSLEEMKKLQSERLVNTVFNVYKNVPFYKNLMDQKGVKPEEIKSIDDLHKLPFLTKSDLREAYPDKLLATPKSSVVKIHSTSGTTGKRVIAYYTKNDVQVWSDCCARALTAAGATNEDVVQISYGYGLFTGGIGLHDASQQIGALTIPMSSGNTDRQIQFMEDLGSTILCCTPSYACYLAESIVKRNEVDKLKLKSGIFGAEAWTDEMRTKIEETLGLKAYDIYGLTEISGPGVAFGCNAQDGMHINEDHFIAEIIDPVTEEVLPLGAKGELVFTCITKEAFPMIRYRTRDICRLTREKCSCGRTLLKMSKPLGRSDDMLIVKGVNVFPSQIESVLINLGYSPNYQIVVDRVNNSDTLDINVEMTPSMFSDKISAVEKREKEIISELKKVLGIFAKVHLVAHRSIARSEGKAVRVIDKRNLYSK